MSRLFSSRASPERRLLTVGGIHVFADPAGCKLVKTEPEGTFKDLGWVDCLALEAVAEGTGEVLCGRERALLAAVAPVRLGIERVDGSTDPLLPGARIKVQAKPYGKDDEELEPGKFTNFNWDSSAALAPDNDPSAVEFGFCDTCFGLQNFRAVQAGEGDVTARLGDTKGSLKITVTG